MPPKGIAMIILPAIDIKQAQCVRLYKGDMSTAQRVADDPFSTAAAFKNCSAKWVHMVDLDGAFAGERKNADIFLKIASQSGLKVELGGGIRTMEDVEFYLDGGISRVVFGSAAVKNPKLVEHAAKTFPGRIAVGIDAVNGKVATEGWVDVSEIDYIELAKRMEQFGVEYIIFTDISRDGMMCGANIEQLTALNNSVSCNIIASGGITDIDDIRKIKDAGIYGAICGRSIYAGTLNLSEAIELALR